jgi:hypothetical protein
MNIKKWWRKYNIDTFKLIHNSFSFRLTYMIPVPEEFKEALLKKLLERMDELKAEGYFNN